MFEGSLTPTGVFGYLREGVVGGLGMLGVVQIGDFVGTKVPGVSTYYMGTDITGKLVRAGVRAGVGYGVDWAVGRMVPDRAALRVGMVIGVFGSLALDLLGNSFTLGAGTPLRLPGLGAYFTVAGANGYGVGNTGAYVTVQGVGARPRLRGMGDGQTDTGVGAHRLYGGAWRSDG